jgi:biotin operon repressor
MPRRPPPAPPKGTKFGGPPRRRNLTLIRATIAAGIKSGQFQHRPGTYALVPLAPLFDPELGSRKRDLLLLLCRYRDAETGQCNPSQGRLARDLGIKRRAVQKLLMELEERGHIMTDLVHQKHGGQTSSQYWIRFAPPPASLSGRTPPASLSDAPPASLTDAPPASLTDAPPASLSDAPPASLSDAPPASLSDAPPCVPVGRTPCVPDGRIPLRP